MKKLHDALASLAARKQDAITAYPAKLGDGSGRVIAGAGLVYVRIADVVTVAACTSVPPIHDLEVWVGYENLQRNVLRVLGQRDALGNRQFAPGVAAHAAMHEFMGTGSLGGTDVVKVQLQQFMPLAVWPYEGLKVIVWPGVAWINGQYKLVADLNQYDKPVPRIIDFGEYAGPAANKEMYYLVGIDNTGNIQVTAGNQVDWGTLALTDIPSVPADMLYPLAAVRRSFEQFGIVINRESSDIVDLRFPLAHKHNDIHAALVHDHNDLYYTKSTVDTLLSTVGGGGGGIYWYVDGALAPAQSVYTYVAPTQMTLKKIYITLGDFGSSGNTVIDVKKNGTSIFTTQLSIPYNYASNVYSETMNISLQAGDILTLDINSAASGSADLTITFDSSSGSGSSSAYQTFNADVVPDNTGSISDEFDSDTMSNWTEIDFSSTATWSIQNGYLRCQQSYYSPGENRASLVKPIPSGDFTIETHVYISTPFIKYRSVGLALLQDLTTTGGLYVLEMCMDSNDNQWLKTDLLRFNNWSSYNSTLRQVRIYQLTDAYYRIARQGNTYHFYHSNNGIGWLKMWSGTLAWVPNYFGLGISVRIDNGDPVIGIWEYFRYWNTFLDITDTTIPPKLRSNIFA